MDKGTHKYEVTVLCDGKPEDVHRRFVERVWWGGGMPWFVPGFVARAGVEEKAKDEAGTGALRSVPGGIRERILKAELGKYISYTLERKAIFLATYHQGQVDFYAAGPDMTRVTWRVTWTPLLVGRVTVPLMVSTFNGFLAELQKDCTARFAKKPKRGGLSAGGWLAVSLLVAYVAFVVGRIARIPTTGPVHPHPLYIARLNEFRAETAYLDPVVKRNTFLIIGGTGFTGSGLVEDLLARGAKGVHVMGRSLPPAIQYPYYPGKEGLYPLKGVTYIKGDVTDVAALKKAMEGVTVVIHTAVSYGDPTFGSRRGKERTEKINVGGMENIWNVAKASGTVKQIIYTSSVDTVFTARDYHNATETTPYHSLGNTKHTYAVDEFAVGDQYARTKIMAERFLLGKDKEAGIRTASLRPSGIYGPGESTNFVKSLNPGWALGALPFYFDETQIMDWTCLYNLVFSHVLAVYKLETDPNVAGGKAYFINDDYHINAAAWDIFKPYMDALGVPVFLWLKIPKHGVPAFGWALETLHDKLLDWTGVDIWNSVFLSYKEGLKAIISHTHDVSRAKKDLGYRALLSTPECQAFAAEEFARRYGVDTSKHVFPARATAKAA